MSDVTDKNPLISTYAADTLDQCADVIDYMSYHTSNDGGVPNDNIVCGGILIFRAVTDALRYEAERVNQQRKRPRAAS